MYEQVTIVVVPRDRFSSVIPCARSIIEHTGIPFRFVFLDFGYSKPLLAKLRQICIGIPIEIITLGPSIPVVAFSACVKEIATPYVAWVDNDTYVTAGWMDAL